MAADVTENEAEKKLSSAAALEELLAGNRRFTSGRTSAYRRDLAMLQQTLEKQEPFAAVLSCSDSRVLAELITQSKPGDLFVVKNIGNIVPPASAKGDTNSTAAAIEFAVANLRVNDIVVCGHSQCGAIAALLGRSPVTNLMPHLRDWLNLAAPVLETLKKEYTHLQNPNEQETAKARTGEIQDDCTLIPCCNIGLMRVGTARPTTMPTIAPTTLMMRASRRNC